MKMFWLSFVDVPGFSNPKGCDPKWMFEDNDLDYLLEGAKAFLASNGLYGKFKARICDVRADKIRYRTLKVCPPTDRAFFAITLN